MEKSREILQRYWGYSFRPLQEEIVDNAIYGHDTLAILPTGGGKSICFQVPGLAREGVTIVISPLIALMQDQVSNLEKKNIPAVMLSSALSYKEIDIELDNARFGKTKFLYLSPERLKSSLFIERFKRMNVALIVVDEAHCISEWGQEFRPSYYEIAALRIHHPEVPILALTASATAEVQEDIVKRLNLRDPKRIAGSVERKNLIYEVRESVNKTKDIIDYCLQHRTESGIVYCQTRRSVKDLALAMRSQGISVGIYHGGMNAADRKLMLDSWLNNSIRVIVATNAFGMGIDKPDVRFVLHFEYPNNLEAYYQEAGRAGRDGSDARAIVFQHHADATIHQQQLETKFPPLDRIKQIYDALGNYLQVAYGSGFDERFPFDIGEFSKRFKLPVGEVFSTLKILQSNGNVSFDNESFLPTRVKLIVGQSALYAFQVSHADLNPILLALLRSYPGIFDRFVRIDEKKIAEIAKVSREKLRSSLAFMEQYGILEVILQSDKAQVHYLQERLVADQLKIRPEVYLLRKEKEFQRLKEMQSYLLATSCRSQTIANYFGSESTPCGKCDNCGGKGLEKSRHALHQSIFELLPATFDEIYHQLKGDKTILSQQLHDLLREEQIEMKAGRFVKT